MNKNTSKLGYLSLLLNLLVIPLFLMLDFVSALIIGILLMLTSIVIDTVLLIKNPKSVLMYVCMLISILFLGYLICEINIYINNLNENNSELIDKLSKCERECQYE